MILDQFGRPISASKKTDKRNLGYSPILDSWREYVTDGITPQRLSSILRQADTGDVRRQAELFELIEEKDAHLAGERGKRTNVILDVDFQIEPATDNPVDKKIAQFCEDFLANYDEFSDVIIAMQDAIGKGYSALEINWDQSEGQTTISNMEFIEQKRFLFHDQTGYLTKTPRLLTDENTFGIEIPAWKVLFHQYGGKSGHPARSAIYRVIAWMWLFKNYALKDWVTFCEVYGMPLRLGKYDQSASEDDKTTLAHALQMLGSDAAGIVPKSTEIEFINTITTNATGSLYSNLAKFCDKQTSKAYLGQTLTADSGDKGSQALGNIHNEVRLDLLRADARAVTATFKKQIIRPLVGFNFGWDALIPRYAGIFEEPADLETKSLWLERLFKAGARIPEKWIHQEFNIPEPEADEKILLANGQEIEAKNIKKTAKKSFDLGKAYIIAKNNANKPVEAIISKLDDQSQTALDGLIEPVAQLVLNAQSLQQLQDNLLQLFQTLSVEDFAMQMQKAIMAAQMLGISEVADGN